MATPPTPKTVALRIELLEVVPLVWRRVLVADQWTLASLHHYLQWVLGWTDSHAHEFEVGDGLIAPDWWIQEAGSEEEAGRYRDERRVSVAAMVSELGTSRGIPLPLRHGGWLGTSDRHRIPAGIDTQRSAPTGLHRGGECLPAGGCRRTSWLRDVPKHSRCSRPCAARGHGALDRRGLRPERV